MGGVLTWTAPAFADLRQRKDCRLLQSSSLGCKIWVWSLGF
jgi:hypothetical protein